MRRIASVLLPLPAKKDEDRRSKKSWKEWLRRRPVDIDRDADADDKHSSTSSLALISLTRQSLTVPPPSLPPFSPDSMFPRSVNDPSILPRPQSLRIHVLKSALLHRSQNSKHEELPCPVSDFPNISRPPVSYLSSPGIRRWLSRPCFEDRNAIYTPVDSGILLSQVSASLPVAAIEYSAYLEFMAEPGVLRPAKPVIDVPLSSPQRSQQLPSPSPSEEPDSPPPMTPTSTSPSTTTVKRVVRFAADNDQDDDDEDGVPLHFIRQKKLREQKAQFIFQERRRMAREDELNRRRREQEAVETERKRARLEAERAQAEKERKQKEQAILAEEVVKARLRRELQRAGGVPALVMRDRENGLNFGVVLSSSPAGERNKPHLSNSSSTASLRSVQVPTMSTQPRKEPSVDPPFHHHQPPLDSYYHSRPPSSYSSSSESIGKRNSLMPPTGYPTMSPIMQMNMMQMQPYAVPQPIIMTYPSFASSNPNISCNPTHAIPPFDYNNFTDYDMQLPLLPPTAPFMKQTSYERRKTSEKEGGQRNSRPASLRSTGSNRDSVGSSSERVGGALERGRIPSFSANMPRVGKPAALGEGAGSRKPSSGLGHPQHRSSSGPSISSSTVSNSRRQGPPIRASTMPLPLPIASPWTGLPTVQQQQQQQQQAQVAMSNVKSKNGTGGKSVSGASSSTVKTRGSIMSGIGKSIARSTSKPSMNSNQGRSQGITW